MLSENIKKLRMANALSQVEMAKRLGVTKQCVSNWENDNVQPSIDMLVKIAYLFKVTTDFLLGLTERRFLEITGLDDSQLAHIQALINDLVCRV